jgi:hypothetical protein
MGDDVSLQTDEDTDLEIVYNVLNGEESVALQLNISAQPKNGVLSNCTGLASLEIKCTYKPNKDFSGLDYIELITSDGDLIADESSTITIEIKEVPDAPMAFDYSYSVKAGNALLIDLPLGLDSDSLLSELTYNLTNSPSNGALSNCIGRQCQYVSEQYFTGTETLTYQIVDQSGLVSNTGTVTIDVTNDVFAVSETFTQGVTTYDGVDVVWVIDNSGSMSGEQAALKANFSAFIDNFLDNGVAKFPFNMAITTTDNYNSTNNPFRTNSSGNIYDLSSVRAENDFANFKADFEEAVLVGINGSGDERVFSSIDKTYTLNPSWFGGNNRLLTYIILSDESEHSSSNTPQEWADKFFAVKDKKEKVSVYPIINTSKDSGARYEQMANLTGTNKVYNINEPFQTILDDISVSVSQNISSYPLNPLLNIIEASVIVTVDGVTTAHTYANNTVQLAIPPAPYATIVVKYSYLNNGI